MFKPILYLATFFLPLCLQAAIPFRVVIDPGHGASDVGAIYRSKGALVTEKDVTLKIALRVAQQLRSEGIWTLMTRTDDREISLPKRTELANRVGADIFISIHMNSSKDVTLSAPEGVETYFLDNATDASSKRLAHLENSVSASQHFEVKARTDLALILKDLRLDANLPESKKLACQVQEQLVLATSLPGTRFKRNRGVKQALFHVLLGADMPSVLIEVGFLSNARDRYLATTPQGQQIIAQAISTAILKNRIARSISYSHNEPKPWKTYSKTSPVAP